MLLRNSERPIETDRQTDRQTGRQTDQFGEYGKGAPEVHLHNFRCRTWEPWLSLLIFSPAPDLKKSLLIQCGPPYKKIDIAGPHISDRQAHSQFTDMKCAIYPPWLEKILKFTNLKCVNIINLSTMVGENFEIY